MQTTATATMIVLLVVQRQKLVKILDPPLQNHGVTPELYVYE